MGKQDNSNPRNPRFLYTQNKEVSVQNKTMLERRSEISVRYWFWISNWALGCYFVAGM